MDDSLQALARKYRTLAEVRRAKLASGAHTPREVMQALSREFPGALRELDVLPLGELDARAAALEAAARDRTPAPWMTWMAGFHALLRAALFLKLRLRGARTATAALAAAAGVDLEFARACASPPGGRVQAVVLARLAALHGVSEDALKAALFPRKPTRAEVARERG